jgi:hypothetical protein
MFAVKDAIEEILVEHKLCFYDGSSVLKGVIDFTLDESSNVFDEISDFIQLVLPVAEKYDVTLRVSYQDTTEGAFSDPPTVAYIGKDAGKLAKREEMETLHNCICSKAKAVNDPMVLSLMYALHCRLQLHTEIPHKQFPTVHIETGGEHRVVG